MKKITVLFLFVFYFVINSYSQENFQWDKLLKIDGNQYELFLKAKRYISNNKGVQYSDEKNRTVIAQLKTKARYEATSVVYNNLIFEYQIRILTKDSRVRVIIDDVVCVERKYKGMPASTKYIGEPYGLEAKKYFTVMKGLRDALDSVVKEVEVELNKPLVLINEDW